MLLFAMTKKNRPIGQKGDGLYAKRNCRTMKKCNPALQCNKTTKASKVLLVASLAYFMVHQYIAYKKAQ
jgi:hypothetical protein